MRQITAAVAERHYYDDKRNRNYIGWSVSSLAKVVASTIQTDNQEQLTKYMNQLNELVLETPEEKKFNEEQEAASAHIAAGSYEKMMSFFGGGSPEVVVDVPQDDSYDEQDAIARAMANYAGVEYSGEDGPQPL